jgi:hypothetical protein
MDNRSSHANLFLFCTTDARIFRIHFQKAFFTHLQQETGRVFAPA